MWIFFLATVNKCTITIMIIINIKNFLEIHFCGFQYTVSKITVKKKKLYCTLMHYKARKVFLDLFSTNQGNSSETTFVVGATKWTSKFQSLAMIGWLNARNNMKVSII